MAIINNPPYDERKTSQTLFTWFTQVFTICLANQQSGITADRPTSGVWIGRRYYDTTLNKPVYVSAVKPIVWRDSAGVIV
jgi:hypothetical protein